MRRGNPKRQLGYIPSLPNVTQKTQTTASKIIDLHYANLLLVERWNWERYSRLAAFLRMTECELASLVMLPHAAVAKFKETNRISEMRAQPIALLLTILEHHVCGAIFHDTIANPFPNLNPSFNACTTREY
jgi:hypothetical protein